MLEDLRKKNPQLNIYSVYSEEFSQYGKILLISEFNEELEYLDKETVVPSDGNTYIAHDENFLSSIKNFNTLNNVFGSIELQYGFVNGNNTKMNSLEYHKSSEINIAQTPIILLLGKWSDIINNQYDSKNLVAFYVPKNTAIEIYPKVLHFSPCKVLDSGFKCGVILPLGTNVNFIKKEKTVYEEDLILLKTNKWLLNHKENIRMSNLGAYEGITGVNIEIEF